MAIRNNAGKGNNGGQGRQGNAGTGGDAGGDGGDDDGGDDDLTTQVNAAVTAHLGRKLPGILGPLLTKAVEAAVAPLREQFASLQGGAEGQQGQGAAAGAGQGAAAGQGQQGQGAAAGQGGAAAGPTPSELALQRKLDDLQRQLKSEADARTAQEAESRNARRDAMLTEGLTKLGVDKHRLRGAMAIARDAMVWDAEAQTQTGGKGAWVWRAQRNGYHEDLPIESGLGEWGKSDEGKAYIAPQQQLRAGGGTGGYGSQTQQRQVRQQGQQDPGAAKQANAQQGANQLFNQVSEMLGGGSVSLGGGGSGG